MLTKNLFFFTEVEFCHFKAIQNRHKNLFTKYFTRHFNLFKEKIDIENKINLLEIEYADIKQKQLEIQIEKINEYTLSDDCRETIQRSNTHCISCISNRNQTEDEILIRRSDEIRSFVDRKLAPKMRRLARKLEIVKYQFKIDLIKNLSEEYDDKFDYYVDLCFNIFIGQIEKYAVNKLRNENK